MSQHINQQARNKIDNPRWGFALFLASISRHTQKTRKFLCKSNKVFVFLLFLVQWFDYSRWMSKAYCLMKIPKKRKWNSGASKQTHNFVFHISTSFAFVVFKNRIDKIQCVNALKRQHRPHVLVFFFGINADSALTLTRFSVSLLRWWYSFHAASPTMCEQ